ncbi:MAG: hypothetical protein R2849_09180 [Thermomicrobiales bacterium]
MSPDPIARRGEHRRRGAAVYGPAGAPGGAVQVLLLETSASNSRAIMDDIVRDTENNCQRGVTVGTIERASVESINLAPADQALLVTSTRVEADETLEQTTLLFHDGDLLGRLSFESGEAVPVAAADAVALASGLVRQIANPPTDAELEAAGVLDQPTAVEKAAGRVKTETGNVLSGDGQYPVEAGLGGLGLAVLLLYVVGARLSRTPEPAVSSTPRFGKTPTNPTLDTYASGDWQPYKSYSSPQSVAMQDDDAEPAGESEIAEDTADLEPPPPILNFPQKPIEEKLKILKEARLKEPRREHRAVRDAAPDVDWTEEISKERPSQKSGPADPAPSQVSRKVLLQKLRSNQSDS